MGLGREESRGGGLAALAAVLLAAGLAVLLLRGALTMPRTTPPLPALPVAGQSGLGQPVQGWMDTGDGGRMRHARWDPPRPPLGDLVLLNGRTEVVEKYQEVAEDLMARGFRVFSFDWRGHGLSSRFLDDPQKGHVPDYAVLVDDLARYMDTVVGPAVAGKPGPDGKRPLVLMAHSMGGQLALRYLIREPRRFAAVVLSSPMTDLITDPWPRPLAEMMARVARGFGFSEAYAFSQHDYDPAVDAVFADNMLTHDPVRFRVMDDLFRAHPEMTVGGVTFGWLAASFRAAALTAVPGVLEPVDIPVLVLSAPEDRLVNAATHTVLCQKLRRCTLVTLPGSGHEPLMEVDAIRNRAWAEIDRFLAGALGAFPLTETRTTQP